MLTVSSVKPFTHEIAIQTPFQVTTVTVNGPYQFRVTSDNDNVRFTNVRFDILGGANFTLNLAVEEFLGTATFAGVAGMVSSPYG